MTDGGKGSTESCCPILKQTWSFRMNSTISETASLRLSQFTTHIVMHLGTPMYANGYTLILNQVTSAGLGIMYWLFAARLYPAEVVGQNSAIISTLMGLAVLSGFSLNSAMTRFVPRAGNRTDRLIASTYGVNLIAAALIGSVFFILNSQLRFADDLLSGIPLGMGWLVLATMMWGLFFLQDGILTGLRQTTWVLIKNLLHSILKIGLLIVCVWSIPSYGIAASWFLPVPFLVVFFAALSLWQFWRKRIAAPETHAATITIRQVVTSVTGDHVGTLFAEICVRVLPLLILGQLGKSANAYFYQAWLIANLLYLIANSMTSAFTVEAAADTKQIVLHSRRVLQQTARLVVPAAIAIFAVAPFGLGFYGSAYAAEGTTLLRLLAVAAAPMILNTWYLSYARVTNHIKAIIFNQGLACVLTLGLTWLWLPVYGISGIGMAWLCSQSCVAALVAFRTAPMLMNQPVHSG